MVLTKTSLFFKSLQISSIALDSELKLLSLA